MKLGNTEFQDGCAKDLSFDEFKKTYTGLLKGYDIKLAFKVLGGVIRKAHKTKEDKSVTTSVNKVEKSDDKSDN